MIKWAVFRVRSFVGRWLLVLLLFVVVGCSTTACQQETTTTPPSSQQQVLSVVEHVWIYAQSHPAGFTLNLETMQPVEKGLVVAYRDTQRSFGKEGLAKAVAYSLKQGKIIGGWLNEEDGYYYFDSVCLFKLSDYSKAIDFAKKNKQMAIYDLTHKRTIKTD